MRGRTVESLLRAVEDWHEELGRTNAHYALEWPSCGLDDFECVEETNDGERTWEICELLNTGDLFSEGREMKHCVASYDRSWTVCPRFGT